MSDTKQEETENDQKEDQGLFFSHKNTASRLLIDYLNFGLVRAFTIFSFVSTQTLYSRADNNIANLSDLAFFTGFGNACRELIAPANNLIKDALDSKDKQRLQEVHQVTALTGVIPFVATTAVNQAYALCIPLLGRDDSQTWYLPLASFPTTLALMSLTTEFAYGSVRYNKPVLWILGASSVVFLTYLGFRQISNIMLLLLASQCLQCSAFALASLAFFKYKAPDERLFNRSTLKQCWQEAKHINFLGLQPAAISLFELIFSVFAINQLLSPSSLSAYQPMASNLIGFANAVSQVLQQRVQFHSRHILNHIKGDPKLLRSAMHRLALHAAWIFMMVPMIAAAVAFVAQDALITLLYNPGPGKEKIVEEARGNVVLPLLVFIARFLIPISSGIVFSVRNSNEGYHKRLNTLSTVTRALSPVLLVAIGFTLDKTLHIGSMGYWIGSLIALSLSNLLNAGLAWKLIEYEYSKAQTLLDQNDIQLAAIPQAQAVVALEENPIVTVQPAPVETSRYGFFAAPVRTLSEVKRLVSSAVSRSELGLEGVGR